MPTHMNLKTLFIWLLEKAVECALGSALVMVYFAFDTRLTSGPAVQAMMADFPDLYRGLFTAFYVTLGYGLTSMLLNLYFYRRRKPISMVWRIGLNLAVFTLSFGAGFAVLAAVLYDPAIVTPQSRNTTALYQLGLIIYPLSLAIVALTTYAGQKTREYLTRSQTLTAPLLTTRQ